MKVSNALRGLSALAIVAAAVVAGYAVYGAQRTEQVYVARHAIPPFTKLTQADLAAKQVPMKAVQPNVVRDTSQVLGHLTSMEVLAGAQVRTQMFSSNASLQDLVNTATGASNVTFSIGYKKGTMDQYIPPDAYVDLVAQGHNNTVLHADHVLVLGNTGYENVQSKKSNNNQNFMLIMTLPEPTYLSMSQNLANDSVQVLMVNQRKGAQGTGSANDQTSSGLSSTGTTSTSGTSTTSAKNNSNPVNVLQTSKKN